MYNSRQEKNSYVPNVKLICRPSDPQSEHQEKLENERNTSFEIFLKTKKTTVERVKYSFNRDANQNKTLKRKCNIISESQCHINKKYKLAIPLYHNFSCSSQEVVDKYLKNLKDLQYFLEKGEKRNGRDIQGQKLNEKNKSLTNMTKSQQIEMIKQRMTELLEEIKDRQEFIKDMENVCNNTDDINNVKNQIRLVSFYFVIY
ncbi:hypothetical protein RFI_32785 [Reticulomyxa filosa]|uniref:Uncharacterized protein n=1 Tax=Reticulomyxa filosa TaxID=46433 RepID=X6LT98_RETFI|nr:hypothetical protein RFI_32785 [Reticulomyxa filosa]|eukprot:ETO04611.1 hypothetical protein RFI_32785 [Reticulomyxa filosa]